ncbi:hypothetical protein ABEW34_04380 [Paenibacillus algorifonticola]|uniref:hypothetical protein n=1 Tax=Paenibacillus algorifonticola TaxID=684063 RepID=UPI003D2B27BA
MFIFKPLHLFTALIALSLFLTLPSLSTAATSLLPFSPTVQTAYDKLTTGADSASASQLKKQYDSLLSAQQQEDAWEGKITAIHYRNEEALVAIRQRIKQLNEEKLAKLAADVKQTKEHYQPLFELYASLRKQQEAAKLLQSKELNAVMKAQLEQTKQAVQLAKLDIKNKTEAFSKLKAATVLKAKQTRAVLETASSQRIKIRSAKSSISSSRKLITAEGKLLTQAVKKGDAAAASRSFAKLLTLQHSILDKKQAIYSSEEQITAIITKANALLAS